jgi:hypothetical protein
MAEGVGGGSYTIVVGLLVLSSETTLLGREHDRGRRSGSLGRFVVVFWLAKETKCQIRSYATIRRIGRSSPQSDMMKQEV